MSAYFVAVDADGEPVWWEGWRSPGHRLASRRPATAAEEMLMDRIVWDRATPADVARLKALLREAAAR